MGWNLLPASARPAFRAAARALSMAVIALPYYLNTNPLMADNARYTIEEVLADYRLHESITLAAGRGRSPAGAGHSSQMPTAACYATLGGA